MGFDPTPEQRAALVAYRTGEDMVLEAGAGTGKTSTLKLLCNTYPNRRGVYLAFNRSIADEARKDFPATVQCATPHSLAFRAIRDRWGAGALTGRLNAPRQPARVTAELVGAPRSLPLGEARMLASTQIGRLVMETVNRFCHSDAAQPEKWHVPAVPGAETTEARARLVGCVLPLARKAWANDLSQPNGRLRFSHDVYLRLWVQDNPRLDGDFVLCDEAQDINPVVAWLVRQQDHMQRIAVGDANQSIYAWRGATDFLSTMEAKHHLYLTTSFRFGQAVADEANKWLSLLDARLRITGYSQIQSTVTTRDTVAPNAVLCRTNGEAVSRLMGYHEQGVSAAVVGGATEVKRLAEACNDLRHNGWTSHPELAAFSSWGMVQDYVEEDAAGGDLKVAVRLIDEHGADTIIDAINRARPEGDAAVTISTAHKAKGREWHRVTVADDFPEPKPEKGDDHTPLPSREDMMLAYVTVTRAQHVLNRSGLAWVDQYLPGGIKAGSPVSTWNKVPA